MNTERTHYIDVAKGVAILLVVYGHAATQLKGTPFFEEYLSVQSKIIFSFVMPVFFMISGSFQRKRLEAPDFNHKAYLAKISSSMLLPFYSLSLLFLLPKAMFGNHVNLRTFGDMIFSLLLQQSGASLPSGVLWFLFTLFSFSIISYLFIKVLKMDFMCLMALAILLRSDLNTFMHSSYFAFDQLSGFLIYYMAGYGLYDFISKNPGHGFGYLSMVLASYVFLVFMWPNIIREPLLFSKFFNDVFSLAGLSGILGSLFILGLSFDISEKMRQSIPVKGIAYCGANSLLIYVFHMPTFAVFNKVAMLMNVESGYTRHLMLLLPGVLLPLVYGKVLGRSEIAYRILLGRNPGV